MAGKQIKLYSLKQILYTEIQKKINNKLINGKEKKLIKITLIWGAC